MARFRKPVVSVGKYVVGDAVGGRYETELTEARLKKWLDSYNRLRAKGYNIPAPFDHDTVNAVPVKFGRDGAPPALQNAGFVENLTLENGTLIAEIEVPGDPNDANSPAGRVGKTVKETSVYVRPNYLDGTGETHDEGFMHVAMVTHAIQPGQGNFQPVNNGLAIAMSQRVQMSMGQSNLGTEIGDTEEEDRENEEAEQNQNAGETDSSNPMGGGPVAAQIVKMLRHPSINIDLPDDTTDGNILERLLVAGRQRTKMPSTMPGTGSPMGGGTPTSPMGAPPAQPFGQDLSEPAGAPGVEDPNQPPQPADQAAAGQQPPQGKFGNAGKPSGRSPVDLRKPPRNAVEQPASIAMSQQTPTTEQQLAVVMSQMEAMKGANTLLAGYVNALEREKRTTRINQLVASGRVTADYADKQLKPVLEGFQMSVGEDGKPKAAPIDTILQALEALPGRTGSVTQMVGNIPAALLQNLPAEAQGAVAQVLMSIGGGSTSIPAGSTEEGHPGGNAFFAPPGEVDADPTKVAERVNEFLKNTH